ncbi:MAG: hypothetical protein QXI59_06270 [Candidatus Bathyarchaeia archaeon]
MTVNEIRRIESIEHLLGTGMVLGLSKLQNRIPQNIRSVASKRKMNLEKKLGKSVNKLLAESSAGRIVNKIRKEPSIGKQTFYIWAE